MNGQPLAKASKGPGPAGDIHRKIGTCMLDACVCARARVCTCLCVCVSVCSTPSYGNPSPMNSLDDCRNLVAWSKEREHRQHTQEMHPHMAHHAMVIFI